MSSSSAAPVLDPLGAPEATFLDAGGSIVATVPRGDWTAPDVTAIGGVEAVAIVRAGGFIAAIESVASDLAEGIVVEQEPRAGERLQREAVITLRLATPPLHPAKVVTESEPGSACGYVARPAGPDDTEEWFQALGPSRPAATAGATSAKRPRKHRRATPQAHEEVFDPSPAPSGAPSGPSRTVPFLQRTRERARAWPTVASRVCTLAAALSGLQWRRASALLAGVLLLALLGTRLFASGDRRVQTAHPRVLARSTDAHAPASEPVSARRPFARRRARPSLEPRASRSPTRRAAPVALVAVRSPHQADATAPPAIPAAPSASGQFAYLGQ